MFISPWPRLRSRWPVSSRSAVGRVSSRSRWGGRTTAMTSSASRSKQRAAPCCRSMVLALASSSTTTSWSGSVSIDPSEYRERRRRFAERIGAADKDAAVVISRGGGTFDRFANVFYLTGHYQSYSYLPETAGLFSGRSHPALVVSASDQAVLCVSVPEVDTGRVAVDHVRAGGEFAATIAKACRDLGAYPGRIAGVSHNVIRP